jgi:hypothetical protein
VESDKRLVVAHQPYVQFRRGACRDADIVTAVADKTYRVIL